MNCNPSVSRIDGIEVLILLFFFASTTIILSMVSNSTEPLRHEANRLFEKGLNPVEVTTIKGHKDTKMLMRCTHLRAEDLVGRLGRILMEARRYDE